MTAYFNFCLFFLALPMVLAGLMLLLRLLRGPPQDSSNFIQDYVLRIRRNLLQLLITYLVLGIILAIVLYNVLR
jgi:hypothetical protein